MMGKPAPVPESCTTGVVGEVPAFAVPVTPVPKPSGPPTVSMLQRLAYWPTPPRTTQLFVGDHAMPRRGITLVLVWNDLVRSPFKPANQIEPKVLVTGLVSVGSKPPIWFWTSLIPPWVSERNWMLAVTCDRSLM